MVVLGVGVPGWTQESPVDKDQIDQSRTAIEKWVDTRKVISKEQQDWALGKEMLKERIDLVQHEIDSLQDKIKQTRKGISDTDKKHEELAQQNDALKQGAQGLTDLVTAFEKRTLTLCKRLPNPLRERIKPLSQRLPEDPHKTTLSLSQRFQNVIGVLNEINKFDRQITVTPELRTLPDGSSAEVTTVYVGLGQAYYTGSKGAIAGVGRPSADGWHWTPANDEAAEIADIVAILKNEKVARFVPVPVRIQ